MYKRQIRNLIPLNGTPLYTAAATSYETLQQDLAADRINAVVLLTDGRNEDPANDDLDGLLRTLRERGATSVLCEGGPSLLTTLLGAGLVDELALTTAPMIVGDVGDASLTTAPLHVPMRWRGGAVIDGTVFALWRVNPDD